MKAPPIKNTCIVKIYAIEEIDYSHARIDIFYYTLILRASVLFGLFVIPGHIRSLTVPETLASDAKRA